MLKAVNTWRRERNTIEILARLSERELADVGIARADLKRVARRAMGLSRDGEAADTMAPSWGHHNRKALSA